MRPPTRIDPILARLRELWQRHPDQRLAQLLVNLANPANPCPEVFHLEDETFLARIDAALAKSLQTETLEQEKRPK
jgi:uncharacterized protein YihD (DUF1040 family)